MSDILTPTPSVELPKPESYTTHITKVQSNLSPLLIDKKGKTSSSAEKALNIDLTTKSKPVRTLPKIDTPVTDTGGGETLHSSSKHSSSKHEQPVLSPLNVSGKDKAHSSTHTLQPNADPNSLPPVSSQNPKVAKVPPLDEMSTAMLSKASPDKLQIDDIEEIIAHKRRKSRILDPLEATSGVSHYNPKEHNGTVTLHYELYNEKFEIKDGTITENHINDTYGLSDVMPNCRLRISTLTPIQMRETMIDVADGKQDATTLVYLPEKSEGTFSNLQNDHSYYLYVDEDKEQLAKEKIERDRLHWERRELESENIKLERDDGRGFDSCTCIYGTPCTVS